MCLWRLPYICLWEILPTKHQGLIRSSGYNVRLCPQARWSIQRSMPMLWHGTKANQLKNTIRHTGFGTKVKYLGAVSFHTFDSAHATSRSCNQRGTPSQQRAKYSATPPPRAPACVRQPEGTRPGKRRSRQGPRGRPTPP